MNKRTHVRFEMDNPMIEDAGLSGQFWVDPGPRLQKLLEIFDEIDLQALKETVSNFGGVMGILNLFLGGDDGNTGNGNEDKRPSDNLV